MGLYPHRLFALSRCDDLSVSLSTISGTFPRSDTRCTNVLSRQCFIKANPPSVLNVNRAHNVSLPQPCYVSSTCTWDTGPHLSKSYLKPGDAVKPPPKDSFWHFIVLPRTLSTKNSYGIVSCHRGRQRNILRSSRTILLNLTSGAGRVARTLMSFRTYFINEKDLV